MPVRLDRSSADFDQRFATFLGAKREVSADVERATRAIVDDVAARGDAALIEATKKFDRLDIAASNLRVTEAEVEAAVTRRPEAAISSRSNFFVASIKAASPRAATSSTMARVARSTSAETSRLAARKAANRASKSALFLSRRTGMAAF